jgi:hypothetical protein
LPAVFHPPVAHYSYNGLISRIENEGRQEQRKGPSAETDQASRDASDTNEDVYRIESVDEVGDECVWGKGEKVESEMEEDEERRDCVENKGEWRGQKNEARERCDDREGSLDDD